MSPGQPHLFVVFAYPLLILFKFPNRGMIKELHIPTLYTLLPFSNITAVSLTVSRQ